MPYRYICEVVMKRSSRAIHGDTRDGKKEQEDARRASPASMGRTELAGVPEVWVQWRMDGIWYRRSTSMRG